MKITTMKPNTAIRFDGGIRRRKFLEDSLPLVMLGLLGGGTGLTLHHMAGYEVRVNPAVSERLKPFEKQLCDPVYYRPEYDSKTGRLNVSVLDGKLLKGKDKDSVYRGIFHFAADASGNIFVNRSKIPYYQLDAQNQFYCLVPEWQSPKTWGESAVRIAQFLATQGRHRQPKQLVGTVRPIGEGLGIIDEKENFFHLSGNMLAQRHDQLPRHLKNAHDAFFFLVMLANQNL